MRFGLPLLFMSALAGQTLRVSSSPVAPGEATRIAVWLESPAGKEPVALQMEIEVPTRLLEVEGPPVAGEDAAAVKSASCAGHWKKAPLTYVYKCIIAGGIKPIANGSVLVLKGKIRPNAKPGNHPIRLNHVLAVDANGKRVPLKSSEGPLTINRP